MSFCFLANQWQIASSRAPNDEPDIVLPLSLGSLVDLMTIHIIRNSTTKPFNHMNHLKQVLLAGDFRKKRVRIEAFHVLFFFS